MGSVLYVGNISLSAVVKELVEFLEEKCGNGSIQSCDIKTAHGTWMSKGYGFVRFSTCAAADCILGLAQSGSLIFLDQVLRVDATKKDFTNGVDRAPSRVSHVDLYLGYRRNASAMDYLWSSCDVSVEISYQKCELILRLEYEEEAYKMVLKFSNVRTVESNREKSLLLETSRAPLVFKSQPVHMTQSLDNVLSVIHRLQSVKCNNSNYSYTNSSKEPYWVRTTDFTPESCIAQSSLYCLVFPSSKAAAFEEIVEGLSLCGMAPKSSLEQVSLQKQKSYALQQELAPVLSLTNSYELPFQAVVNLNHLVQVGILSPAGVNDSFLNLLAKNNSLPALKKLASDFDPMTPCFDATAWMSSYINAEGRDTKFNGDVQYVNKVLVTPIKLLFVPPEIESSNRVTRKFHTLTENFLRLLFVEEDYNPLPSKVLCVPRKCGGGEGLLPDPSDVYDRILAVLQHGLHIGGKHFEFLAFSASQLREHSVWMFASEGGDTANSIRQWMGDFMSFRNIAKCAARMGQSFSSSTHTVNIPMDQVSKIEDIKRTVDGVSYCFSDGIGKISKAFAVEVVQKLSLRKGVVPSAFQIRYGGYKGVVAVDPTSSSKLSLRPSMSKFSSVQDGLDVLAYTQYLPAHLNRQIILLLSTGGVPDETFEAMQAQQIQQLDRILEDTEVAAHLVQASSFEGASLIVEMITAGYSPCREPYLRSLLNVFRASRLLSLRAKARLFVPKARVLMGCLDELGILEYGQVFVQVSPTPGKSHHIQDGLEAAGQRRGVIRRDRGCVVKGPVVIAKNPCLHPGDILALDAVDVPELYHMVDCVVFPQRGNRPHPNECSGSDLDGDLYFVSWDASLIPPTQHEHMCYEPSVPAELDHPVTLREIQEFFVDSMMSDSLGVISNAHLVHADKHDELAKHSDCIQLATLASAAVDFAKTGIPAVIPINLRPKEYPDFMEKHDKPSYASKRVLGKLYRAVKDVDLSIMNSNGDEEEDMYDEELQVKGYEKYLVEAVALKRWYDDKIEGLMQQYDIESEAEIMSGNMLKLCARYNKRSSSDVKEQILMTLKCVVKEARGWFDDGVRKGDEENAKAYAWYHVSYHKDYRTLSKNNHLLFSFPWIVSDQLLQIKKAKQN